MMIEIDAETLDSIARARLKDVLFMMEHNAASSYVHPDDAETYAENIKAVKRLLEYLGD